MGYVAILKKKVVMTIKDAVVKVLLTEARAMAADEIYRIIVDRSLYVFGAQNPMSVVRSTIESACDNSGRSEKYKTAVPCFHFEKNSDGKRMYRLLQTVTSAISHEQDSVSAATPAPKHGSVSIWNDQVEQEFQKWLERENYTQKTTDSYRRAIAQIFRTYADLTRKTSIESKTQLKAIRKYAALLNENGGFIKANSTRHYQFTVALAALERFYASGKKIDSENNKSVGNESEILDVPASPLDTIVDLEKGKTAIRKILKKKYSNGFKLESAIDLSRLRRFSLEYADVDLTLSDADLTSALKSCGIVFNGKVYAVSKKTETQIKELAVGYFENGARVIFYEGFYAKHEQWLFDAGVVSVEMLTAILRRLFPSLNLKRTYFGYSNGNVYTVLKSEILRIWGGETLLNYGQIAERLPYIPIEHIKYALGQGRDFIWNGAETFTHVSKVEISGDERAAVRETAERECAARRYVSVTSLPLDSIAANNGEISKTAVHDAVYRMCLADSYSKSGKIITRKGDSLDASAIMREHCRSLDHCSLDDLLAFEQDLTGECHRWIPMQAGYDVMVRTGENTFVAEYYIDFDVVSIDNAIAYFASGEYLPLRSVTTFAVFPHCGSAWNLFLLESYVRRFSDKFRFETPFVNNKNVGCIVRKHSKLTYNEIMTDAVLRSNVPLNENAIADFLFDNGYRGSHQKTKLADLVKWAKTLRERMD
jgi:hypothetical protein